MRNVPVLLLLTVLLFMTSCRQTATQDDTAGGVRNAVNIDLKQIKEKGRLIAITGYSATSYFIYKGQPMGYEYELLQSLAKNLDLELEMIIARDFDQIFQMLNRGDGDIIAYSITVTKPRAEKLAFTESINTTRQVLVQKKVENWRQKKLHEIERILIRNPVDLIGKKVYVWKNSAYYTRLQNLSDEIGGNIDIVEIPGSVSLEELIMKVDAGEIPYTVADENIALINKTYYPDIDVHTPLSFPQRLAWAVRKTSPDLLKAVNQWIRKMKSGSDYYAIYNKYYKNSHAFKKRMKSDYFSMTSDRISEYDDLIKTKADIIDWDWRLLSSLVYQESEFDPVVRSWAGAVGLMQLIPKTGKMFGASDLLDPEENIDAGAKYLKWLDKYWKEIEDPDDRLHFILASYNVGHEHVQDARRLAEKFDKDPDRWMDNIEYCLMQKSKKKYFNDPVVRYGYCRGKETVKYVKEILFRYSQYQEFIDETANDETLETAANQNIAVQVD